jgi:hypothetical protein
MDARGITKALGGRWAGRYGLARCLVHSDREPSLKVSDDPRKNDGVDVHCFAGCDWRDVKAALARQNLLPEFKPSSRAPLLPPLDELARDVAAASNDEVDRVTLGLKIWDAAGPLRGL